MAQFRSTADILDLALQNAGEVTNGNSPYETQALNYLNRVHFAIVAGGTIPIGTSATVEIDEVWPWSKSKSPMLIELQPKYDTGTISLTQGSEAGTLSTASASSLQGYHLRIDGRNEWFKIASHTAAGTAIELDGIYPDETGTALTFEAVKLDYDLVPSYIVVNSTNNKFQFQKLAGSTLTATLTSGTYSLADLATHLGTVATTAAGGPTITASYSAITRKFSVTSNLAGATAFYIVGNGDQSEFSIHKDLGFDDDTSSASAATQTGTYILGGISRLVEPFKIHKSNDGGIYGVDAETFQRNYPFNSISEGTPDRFSVVGEGSNGTYTVRFNKYVHEKTRVEVDYVPVPRDLKDNSSSIPLVPRKHSDVLEDAATFYIMMNKSDDRMQHYAGLVQGKLKAMISQHRGALLRSGKNFGQIIPRLDQVGGRKKLIYGEPE